MRDLPFAVRIDGYASWKQDAARRTSNGHGCSSSCRGTRSTTHLVLRLLTHRERRHARARGRMAAVQLAAEVPINLTVGQFQVCDPIFKRELRLERFDYDIFHTRVGASPMTLTYDRGVMAAWSSRAPFIRWSRSSTATGSATPMRRQLRQRRAEERERAAGPHVQPHATRRLLLLGQDPGHRRRQSYLLHRPGRHRLLL